MIKLTGLLLCSSPAQREIVLQYLPEHTRLTKEEPGCLAFAVTQTTDPLRWRVEELFQDQAAFDAHQRRIKTSVWGEKTRAIAREYQIVKIDE